MNKQPMYIKGDYKLIAKYNRFDECVQIADLDCPDMGWTDYDPTQGASSDELTEICNSLYVLHSLAILLRHSSLLIQRATFQVVQSDHPLYSVGVSEKLKEVCLTTSIIMDKRGNKTPCV